MMQCWQLDAAARPDFSSIVQAVGNFLHFAVKQVNIHEASYNYGDSKYILKHTHVLKHMRMHMCTYTHTHIIFSHILLH